MILHRLIHWVKPPCEKCPYKLGLVRTMADPCPECRANGYKAYEMFTAAPERYKKKEEK